MGTALRAKRRILLSEEGYSIGVTWLEFDADYFFAKFAGVGPWIAASYGGSKPDQTSGGPELQATSYFAGIELPFVFGSSTVRVVFAPRIGLGWGKLEFGSSGGKYDSGFAYGIEASVLFPKAHIGPTFGVIRAPMDPPGELGRNYDAGATFIGITGVLDG